MRFTVEDIKNYAKRQQQSRERKMRDTDADRSGTPAVMEQSAGDAAQKPSEAQKANPARYIVRFVSVREHLLDEDNLASKFHTDALRYAGILDSDAPDRCKIETTQRKCNPGEQEHTEIIVKRFI